LSAAFFVASLFCKHLTWVAFVRVLIVKPSSLGDILHTFPAVYALQQAFPQLDLSWVVNRSLAEIVEMLPGIDRVIAFPREELGVFKGCSALRSFRRELLAQPYDLALDFQGLLRSALICKFSKAPIRVGFDTAREGAAFFYHHRIKLPAEIRHAVEKNLFLDTKGGGHEDTRRHTKRHEDTLSWLF
jgi:ADP-heptose:LPS heptosyltransferase